MYKIIDGHSGRKIYLPKEKGCIMLNDSTTQEDLKRCYEAGHTYCIEKTDSIGDDGKKRGRKVKTETLDI